MVLRKVMQTNNNFADQKPNLVPLSKNYDNNNNDDDDDDNDNKKY